MLSRVDYCSLFHGATSNGTVRRDRKHTVDLKSEWVSVGMTKRELVKASQSDILQD